ncbi:MAG: alternative ribosome rescue aminoacyl-tRNA hydrolase ArfB [Actinomycetota bacterium]|nr:alternative ribosome rescue aminoacyl-tRNA hydrolase ArfB [Actinomycetota bacterium]
MDDLRVSEGVVIPSGELKWRFDPSGGPGGQHANKASTRVELTFSLADSNAFADSLRKRVLERLGADAPDGVITIQVNESRSQWRNRQIARRHLVEVLVSAMRPPPPKRRPTRPTRSSRERRLSAKRARSETKKLRRRPIDPD